MRLSVGAWTVLYDFGVAVVGIIAGAVVGFGTLPLVGPLLSAPLGGVCAALVTVVIRHWWPSPQTRADRQALADLRRELEAFRSPQRLRDDAARLRVMARYNKRYSELDNP